MRVLHSIPSLDPRHGGPSRSVVEIAQASSLAGIDVTVCFGTRPEETAFVASLQEQLPGVSLRPFPYTFPRRFSASRPMAHWVKQNIRSFDLTHIHAVYSLSSLSTARIARQSGKPYIVRPAGSLSRFDLRKKSWVKHTIAARIVRQMFDGASVIHCATESERARLHLFGSRTVANVLPIPVSLASVHGNRDRFRSTFGFRQNDLVVLFLSRVVEDKGLDLLIRSIALLKQNFPGVRLAIAGSGPKTYQALVRTLIEEKDVSNEVVFCGFLESDGKADALAGSDCFVLPSKSENFGVAVVEALGAGLPVIVSDRVPLKEVVTSDNVGWVCEYSVQSLTETLRNALATLVASPWDKERSRKSARRFAPQALAQEYRRFYDEMLR